MNYSLISDYTESRPVIEHILLNRGLQIDEIPAYINPTAKETFSPHRLANITDAAKELVKTLLKQQKIYVQIDSDCDGYTSAAVLLNYLHRAFPSSTENLISYAVHDKKHHGINMANIADDIKLVIVPDASSNESEFHQELAKRGIATIILDHHHAENDVKDPAIIVNNQMCDYPNKMLSGVGIVYKFCKVMDEILQVSYADDYLDLVALGMIADMMDLRALETRYYIVEGLKEIRNPFFKTMVEKNEFKIKNEFNPFTVSWYVAPFVNAMTRAGTLDEKTILFRSMLEYEAYRLVPSTKRGCSGQEEVLVEQSVRICGNVKNRQEKDKKETLDMIYRAIEEQNANSLPILIIRIEKSLDNNLNGLLANHIMAEFQKPTLILTRRTHVDEETGKTTITWEGSGRGYETKQISDWRSFIASTGHAMYAEGHPNAFGVGFTGLGLIGFIGYITEYFKDIKFEKSYKVDFDWDANEVLDSAILEIASHKDLWGQGVTEPLIALNVKVTKDRFVLMGKGTLKIIIPDTRTTCIKFGFGEEEYQQFMDTYFSKNPNAMVNLTIIGNCRANEWNGYTTPQIEIKDFDIQQVIQFYF